MQFGHHECFMMLLEYSWFKCSFVQDCISLDLGRLAHAYLLCVYLHALFALLGPIYMVNPSNP